VKTVWKIVDQDGDEIDRCLIKVGADIPVQMKSVEITDDDCVIVTVEYLHGQ